MTDKQDSGIFRNLTSYGDTGFSRYLRRAFLSSAGYDREDIDRPVIGVVNTSSDYNTCHRQMPEMVDAVKRGILEAGALPMVFPTISLNEIFTSPTTMLFRNLMAMETEEMIRAQPMDGVVLLGGCDKTVPAQAMAAISANIPSIMVLAGPMMTGHWKGQRLGACTDCRRLWAEFRAGRLTEQDIGEIESSLCATGGTCMVMGTASTMACLMETLGLMLPGSSTPPHASGDRLKYCVASGRQIVDLVKLGLKPLDILSRASFDNALKILMAIGGSTNAIVHLLAIARRAGIAMTLADFNRVSESTPLLLNCKPAGVGYMEDFHNAGGLPVLMKELENQLDLSVRTVTGQTLDHILEPVQGPGEWQDTIRCKENPLQPRGAIMALFGSLAPNGAVIKSAAASPILMQHRGPAIVFESPEDAVQRIDNPDLGITPRHVMILRNSGPVGAGMPEAGSLPIPRYLAEQGVKDMVRVSDARMSGTAYGTIVLHCSPESAAGGPIGLVEDGDIIELNVEEKRIDLLVGKTELDRRKGLKKPPVTAERGWLRLHQQHVLQSHEGCDLDFM